MIKKIIIFLLLFVSSSYAQEQGIFDLNSAKLLGPFDPSSAKQIGPFTVSLGGTPALVCTDFRDAYTSVTRDYWLNGPGRYNAQNYVGIVYDDGATGTICEVQWYVSVANGSVLTKDFYCEIWLLDGSLSQASLVANGRSNVVNGAAWVGQLASFTFATPPEYDCSGSNKYGIKLKMLGDGATATDVGTIDALNNVRVGADNAASPAMTGFEGYAAWNSSGTYLSLDADAVPMMIIRTMQ